MTGRFIAILAALMVIGVTTVVHAQQTTSDSLRHDRTHDQRMITRDTLKLQQHVAVRDSLRAKVQQDQDTIAADKKLIDSLQAGIATAKKASPRDTLAINRGLATLTQLRQKRDSALNRTQRERKRLDFAERTVKRESEASSDARQDLRSDRPKSADSTHTSK